MRYLVYENYPNNKAVVHRAECGFCKAGAGMAGTGGTSNGQWHGPYSDAYQARSQAHSTGRVDVHDCASCKPNGRKQ